MMSRQSLVTSTFVLTVTAALVACGGGGSAADAVSDSGSATPAASSGTAMACLPSAQLASGYRHVLDYQTLTTQPGQATVSGTRRDESSVTGTIAINGVATTRTLQLETFDSASVERTATYDRIEGTRLINPRLDNLTGSTVTDIITYEPAPYIDFGLTAGQSYSVSYVTRSTDTASGTASTSPETETTTFVGRESVTVPLGTFVDACHFKLVVAFDGQTHTLDAWVASGSGIPIKLILRVPVAGGEAVRTENLSAATVNGAAFRP